MLGHIWDQFGGQAVDTPRIPPPPPENMFLVESAKNMFSGGSMTSEMSKSEQK
jgi:hypothetical protein